MRACCIITPHPFWRERMGCGTLMRGRYKLLHKLFDEVLVLFITKSDETCPLPGATLRLRRTLNAQHKATIKSYIKNRNISLCYFSYDYWPGIAEVVNCRTALELHDVMHLRAESFMKFGVSAPVSKTKNQEIEELKKFDFVFCLNLDEVSYLRPKGVACIYLPPSFSFQMTDQPNHQPLAGMIGSASKPNVDGLTQLLASTCDFGELIVAGALSKLDLPNGECQIGLTKLGYVDGPHEFYSKINVALSPVRFGAGLKIKVLEALASGCPVVATSHSVEGVPAGIREVASVEDNYDNWTKDLLKESLSIPKSTIENYITNYFSIDVAETTLKECV